MEEEIRPQFEARKVEKEEKLNETTKSHLEYIEEIEESAFKLIEEDIKVKQNKFGPYDMTDEFAKAQVLKRIIGEFNKIAREQAERGEVGEELSFNLSLPRQEEVEPEKKKIVEAEAQLESLRAWSKNTKLERAMKQFIENQIPLFEGLIKFLESEAKKKKNLG